jgi:head-tail adaptor
LEGAYHQVNVCRSHRMSINRSQELIRRAIGRERISCGSETVQSIFSILVRLKLPSQIVVTLIIRVLEVVFAVAASLPHIEGNVWDWLLRCQISDDAVHVGDGTFVLVLNDAVAQVPPWSIG